MIAHENLERLLARVRGVRPRLVAEKQGTVPVAEPSASPGEVPDPATLALAGRNLREAGLEIVDAHAHLGPYRNFYIPDSGADGLVRVMDRCGVAITCLSSHVAIGSDWILGNRLTAEAAAAYPDRLIGQAVASPHEPTLIRDELSRCFDELGMRAIKLHPDLHQYPITGDGYLPAWEFAAERGCLVLSHTFHGSRYCDPSVFGALAERSPHVPILLVHSGAQTTAFPGAIIDLRYSLGRVHFAPLTPQEKMLILGGNIRRLLRL